MAGGAPCTVAPSIGTYGDPRGWVFLMSEVTLYRRGEGDSCGGGEEESVEKMRGGS